MTNNEALKKVEEFVFEDRAMREDLPEEEWNDYDIFCEENNVAILHLIALARDVRVENTKQKYMIKNRDKRISQLEESLKNATDIIEDFKSRNIQLLGEIQKLQKTIDKL